MGIGDTWYGRDARCQNGLRGNSPPRPNQFGGIGEKRKEGEERKEKGREKEEVKERKRKGKKRKDREKGKERGGRRIHVGLQFLKGGLVYAPIGRALLLPWLVLV